MLRLQRCVTRVLEEQGDPDVALSILNHISIPETADYREEGPYLEEGLCIAVRSLCSFPHESYLKEDCVFVKVPLPVLLLQVLREKSGSAYLRRLAKLKGMESQL